MALFVLSCIWERWNYALLLLILTEIYIIRVPVFLLLEVGSVKRLTDFFVEAKIPFTRRSIIFQKPSRKALKGLTCTEVFAKLRNEKTALPKSLRQDWTYLAVTHQTVITHLQKAEVINEKGLKMWEPGYQSSLWLEQKGLVGKRCKTCPHKRTCYYKQKAKSKRRFFRIRFHTKTTYPAQ